MSLSTRLPFDQLLTKWSSELNPLLANPLNNSQILENVVLIDGTNVINHKLGRVMQGWFIIDQNAAASIYRVPTSPFNNLTLTLSSSAAVTVNIGVF